MKKKYFYQIDGFTINVLPCIIFIIMIIITALLCGYESLFVDLVTILIWYIPYLCFHEILHSIGYVVNGADFKKITYGAHIEKGILCCSCKQEITRKNILWSLIYPFLFIGVITYVIGVIFNHPVLIDLSILNICGASADLAMFFDFLTIKDFKFFEYDNPIAFGITTKEDMTKRKLFGLKLIEENNFKQTIDKKVTISKSSIAFFIFIVIAIILNIIL